MELDLVGKTAIVEGLAERIIDKRVSRVLFGKRIMMRCFRIFCKYEIFRTRATYLAKME